MADATRSTIVHLPHRRDVDIGHIARSWEADICDLVDLSNITETVVEAAFDDVRPTSVIVTPDKVRQVNYCIFELTKKIEAFRDTYYAAIELK